MKWSKFLCNVLVKCDFNYFRLLCFWDKLSYTLINIILTLGEPSGMKLLIQFYYDQHTHQMDFFLSCPFLIYPETAVEKLRPKKLFERITTSFPAEVNRHICQQLQFWRYKTIGIFYDNFPLSEIIYRLFSNY